MDMDTEAIIILLCIALGIAILVGVLFSRRLVAVAEDTLV